MKVKVHYLFSRNKKIGSKIISYGTAYLHPDVMKTPSHIALLVNNRWVHESTLDSGVRVISYEKWLSINEQIAKIPSIKEHEYSSIKKMFREIKDKGYDWLGVTYFGYRLLLNKCFNVNIPSINKWEKPDRYFCCEAVAKLTGVENYSMKAPIDIMVELIHRVVP